MKIAPAILFSIALLGAASVISGIIGVDIVILVMIGTSVWVARDSSNLEFKKYKSAISHGPVMLFLGCILLWIFIFPWYLSVRYKIKAGIAELKDPSNG